MGSLDGVIGTESGWIGKHEVVTVTFRPDEVGFADLLEQAKSHGCASRAWSTTAAQAKILEADLGDLGAKLGDSKIRRVKDHEQIYYLRQSPLGYLPLTPLQARRVNGALYAKTDPAAWLSPRQLGLWKRIQSALAKDPKVLNGLERPETLGELDEYTAELQERLGA